MGLCSGGLIIRRIFASEIWGAYFREGLFFGGRGGTYYQNFTVFVDVGNTYTLHLKVCEYKLIFVSKNITLGQDSFKL